MKKIIVILSLTCSAFSGYTAETLKLNESETPVEPASDEISTDGEFSYIHKEDRAWEDLTTTSTDSRGYEPAPDEQALELAEQATDEKPPFYGWHLERTPSGMQYDYGWYDQPRVDSRSAARTSRQAEGQLSDRLGTSRRASSRPERELKTITGKITDLRSIDLRDEKRATARHHLLRLEFQDGRTAIVNLGPNFFDARRRLSIGDFVRIAGTTGKIENRNVLFARDVAVEKAELSETDSSANRQQTRSKPNRVSKVQLRGFVEDSHRAFLYPGGKAKPLLRVRLENGRTAMVDLGPETSVADLGLKEDASIVVYGTPAVSGGRHIIKADMISVNGDTTLLR